MSRLLPSIALPGYNAMAASSKDPEITALFSDIGMCTTSTLDGLLHAGCVMRQQVIDGCTLAPNVVMQAFAGLYTAPPAQGPMITEICGITPDASTFL